MRLKIRTKWWWWWKQISECIPSNGFATLYFLSQTRQKEEAQPEKQDFFLAGWVPHLISQPEVLEAIIYLFGCKGIRRKFQRCILTITLFDRWPTSIKEHCTQHLLAPYNQPQSAGKGQPRSWSPSLCFPQSPPLPLLSQMSSLRYLESTHKYLKITLKHLRVTHKYWSNNYANL